MRIIVPYNENGQAHGLWEWYYSNGSIAYKRFYYNGKEVGYSEWYSWRNDNELTNKTYHI